MSGPKGIKGKFNLVLSDAFHTEKALVHEMNQLRKYDLIDLTKPFAMFWDDCQKEIARTFFKELGQLLREEYRRQKGGPNRDIDIQGGNSIYFGLLRSLYGPLLGPLLGPFFALLNWVRNYKAVRNYGRFPL